MMSDAKHTCVVGLGWGDEGKGKIVDLLCPEFDYVVRYNGGANAGHTVCVGAEQFKVHLLPAGALHTHIQAVIGPGVVVDPATLLKEMEDLRARGIEVAGRLHVSDRAHVVMPYHKLEDQLSEAAASAEAKIGTTARGIGPCYADKIRRHSAIRVADLTSNAFLTDRLPKLVAARRDQLVALFGTAAKLDVDRTISECESWGRQLAAFISDTTVLLEKAIDSGKRILFEGANGCLLDVDHGTYPFVTSSTTTAAGIPSGAGVPPGTVTRVVGVCKAYATRVGEGPFVSELRNGTGDWIRERGHEFGTTTGRPRRCGWFDVVATRYAVRLGGVTEVAMMHLDTLSELDSISACVGYDVEGQVLTRMPSRTSVLDGAKPVLETYPGWRENLREVRRFSDLPETAQRYVQRIGDLVGAPVRTIGVGPERSQTLHVR